MRSIGDPDFEYRPHSPERKAAASARAKVAWEKKKEAELVERLVKFCTMFDVDMMSREEKDAFLTLIRFITKK